MRVKPPVLSQQLATLIEKDRQASIAADGDIINLDFDPFLYSQDPRGKYVVGKIAVSNNGCLAEINNGRVIAELKKSGSSWLFVNFRYIEFPKIKEEKELPNNDLVHILSR